MSEDQLEKLRYQGSNDPVRHWAPFRKGDREGRRWWADDPLYIDWSAATVKWLYANSGKREPNMPVIRNPHLYFRGGVSWQRTGRDVALKGRVSPPCVIDAQAPLIVPQAMLTPALLCALVNHPITTHVLKRFMNNTWYEMSDLRCLPLVLPDPSVSAQADRLLRRAMAGIDVLADETQGLFQHYPVTISEAELEL
jgi:hypothetical protein